MEAPDKSWLFFTPGTVQSMNAACAMLPENASVMVIIPRCAWRCMLVCQCSAGLQVPVLIAITESLFSRDLGTVWFVAFADLSCF